MLARAVERADQQGSRETEARGMSIAGANGVSDEKRSRLGRRVVPGDGAGGTERGGLLREPGRWLAEQSEASVDGRAMRGANGVSAPMRTAKPERNESIGTSTATSEERSESRERGNPGLPSCGQSGVGT